MKAFIDVKSEDYASNVELFDVDKQGMITIPVKKIETHKKLRYSEIFDSISFVKLDDALEAVVGEISKLVIDNDRIFILDTRKTKSLKVFDLEGKYLFSVGRVGRGPQEFFEPTDFSVFNSEIQIYDQYTCKILTYDSQGEFIKEDKMPFSYRSFHHFENDTYVFQCMESDNFHMDEILDYTLLETDSSYKINYKGAYREYDKYVPFTSLHDLNYCNNAVIYLEPLTRNVLQVHPNGKLQWLYRYHIKVAIFYRQLSRELNNCRYHILEKIPFP